MFFLFDRIIDIFAIVAGILTAVALRGLPGNLDVGFCVAYTVEVLGQALANRKARVFPPSRPWSRILLVHAGFLVAVVAIARVGLFLMPVHFGTAAHPGKQFNWGLVLVLGATFVLAYKEERLLFRKPRTKSSSATALSDGFEPMAEQVAVPFTPAVAMPAAPEVATAPLFEQPAQPAPVAEEPTVGGSISAGVYSAAESDENEAFLLYMHQKEREFRKPGVTVKEEYEHWRAHRAAMLSGIPQKKPKGLRLFR